MKATYGVMGMMEWNALIPTRSNLLRVRFTGGSLSGYGVTPATYTTDNPAVARLIETSSYFRRGRIRLLSKEEDPPCGVTARSEPELPPKHPEKAEALAEPKFRKTKPLKNGNSD